MWVRAGVDNGNPLPDRTFYHYRRSIEEIFHMEIKCDKEGKYYIENDDSQRNVSLTNWMLDSMAVSAAFTGTAHLDGRIEIEDVPSAREFLPMVLDAINDSNKLLFTYAGFSRSRAEHNILFHPYFLKRYKQRWYMIGLKEKGETVRTYALDRIRDMQIVNEKFLLPGSITMHQLFSSIVGVTTSSAPVRTVRLMTTPTQAKYFRALPLHPSQSEEVHDKFSVFSYQLQLNYELAHEILSLGDSVKVLEPPELKIMVVNQLKDALAQYENS